MTSDAFQTNIALYLSHKGVNADYQVTHLSKIDLLTYYSRMHQLPLAQ